MSEAPPKPAPVTDDHDTGGFFAAAQRGELVLRTCSDCGHIIHLPAPICDRCRSTAGEWRPVRPAGTVYSFTRTERLVHPSFVPPYAVVIVELDDAPGARLVGYMDGRPELSIGQALEGYFEDVAGAAVLRWRPAGSAAA